MRLPRATRIWLRRRRGVVHNPARDGVTGSSNQSGPSFWQDLVAGLLFGSADAFKVEVLAGGGILQACANMGAIRKQVLEPRPAFADLGTSRSATKRYNAYTKLEPY